MLTPHWQVAECQFDVNQERLNILMDFLKGSQFSCPACDQADCAVHDKKEKSWRHLNFFQHETYMSARVPRTKYLFNHRQATFQPALMKYHITH